MLFGNWMALIHDMKDAFLKGKLEDCKDIFMEVPQGMEHHYWGLAVLRQLKPIYRLKQAALLFGKNGWK